MEELDELAHDLLWTWQPRIENLFRTLDPELWESTRQNPVLLLARLGEEGVARASEREDVRSALEGARAARREYYEQRPRFMDAKAPLVVAYFSLEFGLAECLPIYSRDVLAKIRKGDSSWENMVPPQVAGLIKQRKLFGFAG